MGERVELVLEASFSVCGFQVLIGYQIQKYYLHPWQLVLWYYCTTCTLGWWSGIYIIWSSHLHPLYTRNPKLHHFYSVLLFYVTTSRTQKFWLINHIMSGISKNPPGTTKFNCKKEGRYLCKGLCSSLLHLSTKVTNYSFGYCFFIKLLESWLYPDRCNDIILYSY